MVASRAAPILAVALAASLSACTARLECGANTLEVDGVCVGEDGEVITVTKTEPVYTDTDPVLTPGNWSPVFSELKKMLGGGGALGAGGAGQTHMHTFDVKYRDGFSLGTDPVSGLPINYPPELVYCSYTFGVANASNPESMAYLAQGYTWPVVDPDPTDTTPVRPPGCHRLDFDDVDPDIIYVAMHGNLDDGPGFVGVVDLNHSGGTTSLTPTAARLTPLLAPQLIEGEAPEGIDFEDGRVWVARRHGGIAVYHRDADGVDDDVATTADNNTMVRDGSYDGSMIDTRDVIAVDDLLYVADGANGLYIFDISDPLAPLELSHVLPGGVAHDIELNADHSLMYVALETAGWAIVDIQDPAAPVVRSITAESSAVAAIAEHDGWVSVAAWNDTRVYEVTDPAHPRRHGAVRIEVPKTYLGDEGERPDMTGRTLATDIHGDILYNGDWWTPYTFQIHKDVMESPYIYLPETYAQMAFPGDLQVGEVSQAVTLDVYNYGTADLTLHDNWVDNPAFTVTPWQARIPPGGKVTLTMTFSPSVPWVDPIPDDDVVELEPVEETALLYIRSDDPMFPERKAFLVGNKEGISVGDPFPEDMAGLIVDNTDWTYQANASGQVLLFGYFATF